VTYKVKGRLTGLVSSHEGRAGEGVEPRDYRKKRVPGSNHGANSTYFAHHQGKSNGVTKKDSSFPFRAWVTGGASGTAGRVKGRILHLPAVLDRR